MHKAFWWPGNQYHVTGQQYGQEREVDAGHYVYQPELEARRHKRLLEMKNWMTESGDTTIAALKQADFNCPMDMTNIGVAMTLSGRTTTGALVRLAMCLKNIRQAQNIRTWL